MGEYPAMSERRVSCQGWRCAARTVLPLVRWNVDGALDVAVKPELAWKAHVDELLGIFGLQRGVEIKRID